MSVPAFVHHKTITKRSSKALTRTGNRKIVELSDLSLLVSYVEGFKFMFRTVAALLTAFSLTTVLASCGFEPVYGSNSPHRETLTSVEFADPRTENDFNFLKYVEQVMPGDRSDIRYRVNYRISMTSGERLEDVRVRRGAVNYEVTRLEDRKTVFSGSVRAITDLRQRTTPDRMLTNRIALQSTDDHLLQQLAQAMHMELIARFASCGPSC
ncbi:MAG: hypothetical protein JJU08_14585 [Rhodobacteraceae bacterium]|nr:hypothetical protein [Paracoccaceae bacterium]